jgi:Rieske Fe-S protein
MAEPNDTTLGPRAERFERYIDALLAGGRPSPEDIRDRGEAEMARLAAEMSAAADPEHGAPDPAFVEQLRVRMRQADQGIAAVREPLPIRPGLGGSAGRVRVTRRQLLTAAVTGAAGMAAGAAAMTVVRPVQADEALIWDDGTGLVPTGYEWVDVAVVKDVPDGGVLRFSTAAFDGYIVKLKDEIWALSSVCTHMGCTLQFRPDWSDLRCPCHGASFNLEGQLANGRAGWRKNGGYKGDQHPYAVDLPNLVRPDILVRDGRVLVKIPHI